MTSFEISTKKLWSIFCLSGVFFAILSWAVINGITESTDMTIIQFFSEFRTPFLNEVFLFLTYLGSTEFLTIATIFISIVLLIKKRTDYFLHFSLTVLSSASIIFLFKQIFGRIRPTEVLAVYSETSFSFPSGHTSLSVVFYGTLAYILAERWANKQLRKDFLFGWIFFMLMIGFSRMYLGVHYASDVLGGYFIGFFCLSLSVILFEKYSDTKKSLNK